MNTDYSYLVFSIGCLIVLFAISFATYKYLYRILFWLARKTPNQLDDRIVEATHKTVPVFFFITGVYQLLMSNKLLISTQEVMTSAYQSFLIIVLFWTLHRFVHTFEKNAGLFPFHENQLYAPYMLRLAKVALTFIGFYMLLENWGYDLSKLLAGVGITGIAFAFAARDTFSNIFSGMVIIVEKPFLVGDQISAEEIEGTITDINFRSTTIDTVDKVQLIVPNSKLINSPLINKTKCKETKIEFYVVYKKNQSDSIAIQEILESRVAGSIHVVNTVSMNTEAIFEDIIIRKLVLYSNISSVELAEKREKYLGCVLKDFEEANVSIYYIGTEKPNIADVMKGTKPKD